MVDLKNNLKVKNNTPVYPIKFLNPKDIVSQLEISTGMKVAHFGCGTGYFTFAIAQKIGNEGTIYALDILEQKIAVVKSQARLYGLINITAKRANLEEREGSGIESDTMDWVIMVNMLYQNDKKSLIIGEAKRILKKGGRILLIDWNDLNNSIGPESGSRVSKEELIRIFRKNNLGIAKEIKVSDFHFGMVLVK